MKKTSKKRKYNRKKKKNNKIILFVFIVLFSAALICGGYWVYKNYKYSFALKDDITVSLGTPVDPKAYIKTKENAAVVYNEVDTSTVGKKKIKYTVTDKLKRKHYYYLTVNVTDDLTPIIEGKDSITIYKDSKIDLNSYVKVTDNYDKNLNIVHEGSVDTSKTGTYKVIYKVTDSSGNTTSKTVTFTVKEKVIYEPVTVPSGVVGKTSKGYTIENKNGATYINGILIANKSYVLSYNYGNGLTSATKSAFEEMKSAANLVGVDLYIGSGFRSYNTQKSIYNNYVKRDGKSAADTYSARPGYSEHQTGLAIDICSHNENKACVNSNFNNTATAKWLNENAHFYGFILRYPSGKSNETGYMFESWHYRYVGKELANILYNNGNWITLESYLGITSQYSS